MISAKMEDGFTLELDDNAIDQRLLDEMVTIQDAPDGAEAIFAQSRALTLFLGKANKKRLYDHLQGEDGHVSPEAVGKAFAELMGSFSAGKNSSSSQK